jgi:hypothetical protein
MFEHVRLHGGAASLLWGYRTAVVLRKWTIKKHEGKWTLIAAIERVDPFQSRQRPLVFTAPRAGGFWCWPIESLQLGTNQLSATLGPPEQ